MRKPLLALAGLVAVLALAAIAPSAAAATSVTLTAKESGCPKTFCIEPANATAPAGDNVTITYKNGGQTPHNICVQVGGQKHCAPGETQAINGGETTTLSFTMPTSGSVEYWCNLPGHRDLGMVGNFTVGPAMGGTPSPGPTPTPTPSGNDGTSEKKGSPGIGIVSLALGVGLLAVALRRRN